jgi:hypothetical protein
VQNQLTSLNLFEENVGQLVTTKVGIYLGVDLRGLINL